VQEVLDYLNARVIEKGAAYFTEDYLSDRKQPDVQERDGMK